MSIPNWTAEGLLPLIDAFNPVSTERSPYRSRLTDVVLRFGTSKERCQILVGWLNYRSALHAVGLIEGFQWLDGSFLEDIEMLDARAPRDIDCVTFYRLPKGIEQRAIVAATPELFRSKSVKAKYMVDAYTVNLSLPDLQLIEQSRYWYSVWSHRRDFNWKGFIEVDLDPTDEDIASELLSSREREKSE